MANQNYIVHVVLIILGISIALVYNTEEWVETGLNGHNETHWFDEFSGNFTDVNTAENSVLQIFEITAEQQSQKPFSVSVGTKELHSRFASVLHDFSNQPVASEFDFRPMLHQATNGEAAVENAITFGLPEAVVVKIEIYDLLGSNVYTAADRLFEAGSHRISVNAEDFSSGLYLYRMTVLDADRQTIHLNHTRKLTFLN